MKRGTHRLALGLLVSSLSAFSQVNPLVIEWQRSFGGTGTESACVVRPMSDGGYVVGGSSGSTLGGNKTSASYGSYDLWSVRINSTGEIVWQRSDGGSFLELSSEVVVLPNGDVLRAGTSDSWAGTGNKTNANNGSLADPWLVRMDGDGNKLWDRAVGTVYLDITPAIEMTSDGGFSLAAQPKPRSPQDYDFQVWRLGQDGTVIWSREYGGPGHDLTTTVQQTSDGGYVVGGESNSGVGGHKSVASAGGYDFWVVRVNAAGEVLWDGTYGGEGEERLRVVRQTADGGFILAGTSKSAASGNKTSASFGSNDFWIVRIDATGNKLWDRAYGGTWDEGLASIELLSDGGLIAGGYSTSDANGSKTAPPLGTWDGWLVRLDSNGNQLWDQSLGGSNMETINSVQQTADGGFIVGADSLSGADGNKTTANFGDVDLWVIKLGAEGPSLNWQRNNGEWNLVLRGLANRSYRIEVSSNLLDWAPFRTNQADSAGLIVLESVVDTSAQRYFRARDYEVKSAEWISRMK